VTATLILLSLLYILGQASWDYYYYEDRQKKWENEHPGEIYINNYRKLKRKSDMAKRMNGEV